MPASSPSPGRGRTSGWPSQTTGIRVVVVSPGDPRWHWEKARAVLEVVDEFLGTGTAVAAGDGGGGGDGSGDPGFLRQPDRSDVYLAVTERRVAGCLLAEPLRDSDRVARSFLRDGVRCVRLSLLSFSRKINNIGTTVFHVV